MNIYIFRIVLVLIAILIFLGILSASDNSGYTFLEVFFNESPNRAGIFFVAIGGYLILLNTILPISLMITL